MEVAFDPPDTLILPARGSGAVIEMGPAVLIAVVDVFMLDPINTAPFDEVMLIAPVSVVRLAGAVIPNPTLTPKVPLRVMLPPCSLNIVVDTNHIVRIKG